MNAEQAPGAKDDAPLVLLVDDEACVLEEYSELLEIEGISCWTETNPLRAFERVLATPSIRVLVTDLRMPELNGMELIRKLRDCLPEGRSLRYIVLSGYLEGLEEIRSLGDIRLLAKPVDADDLSGAIAQGLDG